MLNNTCLCVNTAAPAFYYSLALLAVRCEA